VEVDQTGGESSYSASSLVIPGGSLSESEKTDSLETRLQPGTRPSVWGVTEMLDMALKTCFLTPASEPKLTYSDEVQEAISGLKLN